MKEKPEKKLRMKDKIFLSGAGKLAIAVWMFAAFSCDTNKSSAELEPAVNARKSLPHFGEFDIQFNRDDAGNLISDTVYYSIPKFSFTNQYGQETFWKQYENYITIADFFFTECPTICPVMSSQLARIQDKIKADGLQDRVRLISFSVKPQNDTPEILKAYGEKIGADFQMWNFVTGNENDIYELAEDGFMLTAFPSDSAEGGIFHTDKVTLLDRELHIRGYYDGTSTKDMDALYEDLKLLIDEK
jgi:protein SCO1/2